MKISHSQTKRKRIILYYFLGLILPGMVLGLLAVRGLKNDQALREKESRQELQLLAVDLFTQFESQVESIGEALSKEPKGGGDLVNIGWTKAPGELPEIIQGQMIYWPDGTVSGEQLISPFPEIEQIQKEEFSAKNFRKANLDYQKILDTTFQKDLKILALLGLGRTFKKSGQFTQAVTTYQSLAQNHPGEQLSDHLPVGAIALAELIRLHLAAGDSSSAQTASDQLVRFFIYPPVRFERTQFDYLFESWRSISCNISQELQAQLTAEMDKTAHLLVLHEMSRGLFSSGSKTGRYVESGEYPGLFIQVPAYDESMLGWVLSLDLLMDRFFPDLVSGSIHDNTIKWAVKTDRPEKIFGSSEMSNPVEINFPPGYPPWILQLENVETYGWKRLFQTSQGVLILVFIFIILLMIAGFTFMLHTLHQEMKLNKMKSNFISNVSHEFKTPLTSIRHMTEIMHLKRIDSEDRKEEYLQSMLEQCDHLGHLIENILDFSKIEENVKNYRFEYQQIDDILHDLVPVFRSRITEPDFELNFNIEEVPPPLNLDRDAMLQVFYNLMDNAYKYSGGAKRIEVSVGQEGRRAEGQEGREEGKRGGGHEVLISVRDWGLGIPERELGRIFERFYRGDRLRTEGIKGSGIGLTIVKRIVEAHEGRIEVESEVGRGTVFTVILPVKTQIRHD